ncbi:MAG: hypothetical protein FJY39_03735 [Betaproteobacteria bacterium]|nr:hypothetical protein [Betaproteobacteria bacterium]
MRFFGLVAAIFTLSSCAVVAVADLAVSTAATVAKVGVRTAGAAVDLVLPDKKSEADKSRSK